MADIYAARQPYFPSWSEEGEETPLPGLPGERRHPLACRVVLADAIAAGES